MRASLIVVLAAAATATMTLPAAADTKKDTLTNDGYKCVRVAVNFIECTKEGSPTYWCTDAGVCEAKPRRAVDSDSVRAPTNGILDPGPRPSPRGPKAGQALPTAPAVRQ